MTENVKDIFLITQFGDEKAQRPEVERLVSATSRSKAQQFVMGIKKASAADVARLGSEKIEQASE